MPDVGRRRMQSLATSLLALLLLSCVMNGPREPAPEPHFAPGSWVAVYATLNECPGWRDRIIQLTEVPPSGSVCLLKNVSIDVRGKTADQVQRYLFSKLTNPAAIVETELRIALIPADYPYWNRLGPRALSSLWSMREGNCFSRRMDEIRAQLFPAWDGSLGASSTPRGAIKRPICRDDSLEPRQ